MCNIHRIFEDYLFESTKTIKELLNTFKQNKINSKIDDNFLSNLLKTILKNEKSVSKGKKEKKSQR